MRLNPRKLVYPAMLAFLLLGTAGAHLLSARAEITSVRVGPFPDGVAVGEGAVWVANAGDFRQEG